MAGWKDQMAAEVRELRLEGKIVFGSGRTQVLTGDMICGLNISEGADGELAPGSVLSATCTLELANDGGQWSEGGSLLGGQVLRGATLMLKLGVADADAFLWQDLGVFQIERAICMDAQAQLRIEACDSIAHELNDGFQDSLQYPATLEALWQHAVGQTRYIWSGTVPNGNAQIDAKPDWKGTSLRGAMGWIAAAAGSFVRVNRAGALELCPLTGGAAARVIPAQSYLDFQCSDSSYGPVDALCVKPQGAEAECVYRVGNTALYTISISDNPLFQEDAPGLDALSQGLLEVVAGFQNREMDFTWRGDPTLNIGDSVKVVDLQNRTYEAVLTRQSLRFAQGLSASCSCAVPRMDSSGVRRLITPEGGLNAAALTGAVDGELLSVGSVTASKIAANAITAEKLEAMSVDAHIVSAVQGKFESINAGNIETDALGAELARIGLLVAGSADIGFGQIKDLVAGTAIIAEGVGGQLFISRLAVTEANMVSLTVGELVVKGADGSFYSVGVGADGQITTTLKQIANDDVQDLSLNAGEKIIEGTVTAACLNATDIFANNAIIRQLIAANIDVAELFANNAFVSELYTSQIFGGKSIQMIAGEAQSARDAADAASETVTKTVKTVDVEYYLSESPTELAGGSWSTTAPAWVNGKYMWSRTTTILQDGSVSHSNVTCIAGAKGATGATGATGNGIAAIVEEFYLSTSKETQTGGSWQGTMPAWVEGKYVWTRSKITYTNGTTAYTEPYCDTGWEAANDIQIGGRNLFPIECLDSACAQTFATLSQSGWGYRIPEGSDQRIATSKPLNPAFFELGKAYTVSFVAWADAAQALYLDFYPDSYSGAFAHPYVALSNAPEKFSVSGTLENSAGALETPLRLRFWSPATGATAQAYVTDIKIERGTRASDWSPAPEDGEIYVSAVPPQRPVPEGKQWIDQSVSPWVLRTWMGADAASTNADYPLSGSGSLVRIADARVVRFDSVRVDLLARQEGSGYPSPTNVRPISGLSGTAVNVCGKNLIPRLTEAKTISGLTVTPRSDGSIAVKGNCTGASATVDLYRGTMPPGTYTISGSAEGMSLQLGAFSEGTGAWVAAVCASGNGSVSTGTVRQTIAGERVYHRIFLQPLSAAVNTFVDVCIYPQLEAGSAATPYEPYAGDSYAFNFGRAMYGLPEAPDSLELDADSGATLTQRTGTVVLDGEQYAVVASGFTTPPGVYAYTVPLPGIGAAQVEDFPGICSHLIVIPRDAPQSERVAGTIMLGISGAASTPRAWIFTTRSTAESVNGWFSAQCDAGTPVTILYQRATPTVRALEGAPRIAPAPGAVNTVFTGDGDAVHVECTASGWETINDTAAIETLLGEASIQAQNAQTAANEVSEDLERRVRLDSTGLHVGDSQTGNELLLQSAMIHFVLNGARVSTIASDYHRFGNMEIRTPSSVGGIVIQSVQ